MSTKGKRGGGRVQRLPPEGETICDGCGNAVRFKVRATKLCKTRPGSMIAYLVCPVCGQKATQVRQARRRRARYVYVS